MDVAGRRPSARREQLRVVAVVLLAFVPFALVVAIVVSQHAGSVRADIQAAHLAHARAAGDVADGYIEGNLATLLALSQMPSIRDGKVGTIDGILAPVLKADPNWLVLGLSSADGLNLSSLSTPPRTVSIADRDYFRRAIAGAPAVGSVIVARGTLATKTIVLAVPIEFSDGSRGVLSGALQLGRLEQFLREALPATYSLRVADSQGQEFIGSGVSADRPLQVVSNDPDMRVAVGHGPGTAVVSLNGTETLIAFDVAERAGWTLVLSEPAATAFAAPEREILASIVLTLAGLVAALVIAMFFGARLGRTYFEVETERERLRGALAAAPGRVGLLLGPELRYAVANPEHIRALGKRPEEVVGRPFREVTPDPRSAAVLEEVYRTGVPRRSQEARVAMRQSDGTERVSYFDTAIVPVRDADGKIDGVVYHALDVTDLVLGRERVEELAEAIASERDELQQVVDAIPEGVVVVRKEGPSLRNRAADAILGRGHDEDIARARAYAAETRRLDGMLYRTEDTPIMRALLQGELVHGEQLLVHNHVTGEDTPVLASAAPVRREGEIVAAVSVFQDISAIKALEAQRVEFFSVASHEIKTPITAIQLQLELAQRVAGGDTAKLAALVGGALRRTKALVALVNDLLDTSRIESGRLELQLDELDLAALAREVGGAFPTDETHPIRVRVPTDPVVVRADRRRITEVVENLLANAVKYSPEGGAIDVEVGVIDGEALLRVRDRGIGVPTEERAYVFDRFYRTTRARPFGGVGLGLYISREIARRHAGDITLETTSESGSTFAVTLPLVGASTQARSTQTTTA